MISTKTGDKGKTQWQNQRLPKDCPNFDFIGDLDELSSLLGVVRSFLEPKWQTLHQDLIGIQKDLMLISSLVAYAHLIDVDQAVSDLKTHLKAIETKMEKIEKSLPHQKHFIILGGSKAAAFLHLSRSVTRRCERQAVAYFKNQKKDNVSQTVLPYLNRLSDYLYLLARWVNHQLNIKEVEWA